MEKKAIPRFGSPLHASYLVVWLLLFEMLLLPGAKDSRLFPKAEDLFNGLFSLKAIAQEQPGAILLRNAIAIASIPPEAIASIPPEAILPPQRGAILPPQRGAILPPQRGAIALNRSTCPENLEALIGQMLPDLPGYANRVLRREPLWNQADVKIYVVTAGNPEFEPLPLGPGRSTTGRPTLQEKFPPSRGEERIAPTLPSLNSESNAESEPDSSSADRPQTPNDDPQQVFITTLERQYRGTQVVEIPRYHWLFLTKTTEGWRLALIFSRMGSNRPNEPLTPPEESSDSFMAEAIRLWLRDLWLKNCGDRQNA